MSCLSRPSCSQDRAPGLVAATKYLFRIILLLVAVGLAALVVTPAAAQTSHQMVRLAKLDIYPEQLSRYQAFLREEIEMSLRVEPGVLTLYAVAEKAHPTRITILEIYASNEAYQAHVRTPHFLKYKTGTAKMVKSLELVETMPLIPDVKVK
jgi:quinol monooxygenase YgiN